MQLDPVQVEALKFARGKRGVGFFMDMGLGKSLLALEEFRRGVRPSNPKMVSVTRMIIVTPNSFKSGFLDEIEKHGFEFDAHIFASGSKTNEKWLSIQRYEKPPVLIVNYEAIRTPTVLLRLIAWMRIRPTALVLDESIQIKTHDSLQTKAALALAKEAARVRCLTGKPQSQGVHDLYPQLQAIGLFQTMKFWAFRNTFAIMGGWENKQVVGVKNTDQLANIMSPVVFQAKKSDWLPDLPRKDYIIHSYEMSNEQAAQYKQMHDEFVLELETGMVTVDVAVSKYEKLSQIQTGFILDENGTVRELVPPTQNPRLAVLRALIEQIEGKVIVIYRHRAVFDLLYNFGNFDEPAFIKGGMKPEEIAEQKDRFNNNPACRVLLGQAEASRYGHTLISDQSNPVNRCSTLIFFENSYSLDTRTQVEDRIHRRGQRAENCLYIDISGSELDRRVVKALQRKEDLYVAVFSKLKEAIPA